MRALAALFLSALAASSAQPSPAPVLALLERLFPGASGNFTLSLLPPGAPCDALAPPCFVLTDGGPGGAPLSLAASGVSELAAGLGHYLREFANQTVGWPRGGGLRLAPPASWPRLGAASPHAARRVVPISWFMNVCTHSYSLVWYRWQEWEAYLDWQALSGVTHFYGYTGQEEVQYKVFSALGVQDLAIRSWFNGPAYLTWSRGQNSHGGSIAGPLPRSFMRAQWDLQRQILARARELGQVAVLPGFQGNVPWPLAALLPDANITFMNSTVPNSTPTGWMSATDPAFARVAALWMQTLLADFGTDHYYAADGFFHNGTGWGEVREGAPPPAPSSPPALPPQCAYGPATPGYLKGCAGTSGPCPAQPTLLAAQAACAANAACSGVTLERGAFQLRAGATVLAAAGANETSWLLLEAGACHGAAVAPDPAWLARGVGAYSALAAADPLAVWVWQGWALSVGSMTMAQLAGFAAAPPNASRFLVLDMSSQGKGQWQAYGGGVTPFVYTSLHTFGGNDALKGNISFINDALPWAALSAPGAHIRGLGATPEGFDQNPAYYETILEAAFRAAPLPSVSQRLALRAHRRYGLAQPSAPVTAAWALLAGSIYALDQGVSDATAVGVMGAGAGALFWSGSRGARAPTPLLCSTWAAWGALAAAAPAVAPGTAPFSYDLVNTGREVLAQVSGVLAEDFAGALRGEGSGGALSAPLLQATGSAYAALLADLDALLACDGAFLLGPWLALAASWGGGSSGGGGEEDCGGSLLGPNATCAHFYTWNAKAQLTTWYPVAGPAAPAVPARDADYARKHWAGLVGTYYAARVRAVLGVALGDAARGAPLNATAVARAEAALAWEWSSAPGNPFPLLPQGDPAAVSQALRQKYGALFEQCPAAPF